MLLLRFIKVFNKREGPLYPECGEVPRFICLLGIQCFCTLLQLKCSCRLPHCTCTLYGPGRGHTVRCHGNGAVGYMQHASLLCQVVGLITDFIYCTDMKIISYRQVLAWPDI
jgi:hypothetical protein